LPPGLELAWGLRQRPGKGPRPGLSVQQIVEAAIAVADADGFAAVSMSRVATELGCATMALYRYVTKKEELVALMRDGAFGLPPTPVPGEGWRPALADWAAALLAGYRARTWLLDIPLASIPAMPNELAWMEAELATLRTTGLGPAERMSVLLLVAGYVRNTATMEQQIGASYRAAAISSDEAMAGYATLLRELVDPQRFPEVSAILATGVLDRADDPDDEFRFGLNRLLDGVEVLIG
jgi:AcrR family transcriptional regulator